MRKEQSRREQHQRRGKTGCACVCGFLCSWTCYLLFEIEATPQLLLLCTFCLFDYWLPDARVSFISAGQKLGGQQSCSRSMKERERAILLTAAAALVLSAGQQLHLSLRLFRWGPAAPQRRFSAAGHFFPLARPLIKR